MNTPIIVPVSGGKDSQVVLSIALKTGRRVIAVHQDTGFDHPDTYAHLDRMAAFYGVYIYRTNRAGGGMLAFLEQAQYFPNSAARGCTQRLKQEPFAKWLISINADSGNVEIWFGMRADESSGRASKYGSLSATDEFTLGDVASFYNKPLHRRIATIPIKLPIVDWTTEQVFTHLRETGAPINPLYDRGHQRVGCYPCFLARKKEWELVGRDPHGRHTLTHLISLEEKWAREGNPRKFIKVHRRWDVRDFLSETPCVEEDVNDECGWCSI